MGSKAWIPGRAVGYRTSGVGKTFSARQYANGNEVGAHTSYKYASEAELAALIGSHTVFYTPKAVNSLGQVEEAIQRWRNHLRAIPLKALGREEIGKS
jgi:hypothetical protein